MTSNVVPERGGRVGIVAVTAAALIVRLRTVGTFETIDEFLWMRRSQVFSDALVHFHPSKMSVAAAPTIFGGNRATMPGVPTMWLGSIARLVWSTGRSLGLIKGASSFDQSLSGLALAQAAVAVATSLLIGLIVWLVTQWGASVRAAVVAGLLLATEPFWVAHGSVIHTDELTALFGVAGLLALGLALGVPAPHPRWTHRRGMAIAAGVLLACSPLTKITGLGFVPGALVIVGWAVVRAVEPRSDGTRLSATLAPAARVLGFAGLAGVLTVVVLWPALWTAPGTQIEWMRETAKIGSSHRPVFFDGKVTTDSTPIFYTVTLPFRMTPWMLAGLIIGVPAAVIRRRTHARALVLLAAAVPIAYALSTGGQQVDRYGTLVLAPACVVVGLAASPGRHESARMTKTFGTLVVVGGLLATIHAAVVAPWGMAYYNPVLGGGSRAVKEVPVGWQEGQEIASRRIEELQHGRCRKVTWFGLNLFLATTRECGLSNHDTRKATYVAIYVTDRQTMSEERYRELTHGRKLVSVVRIRGIDYVELWRRS